MSRDAIALQECQEKCWRTSVWQASVCGCACRLLTRQLSALQVTPVLVLGSQDGAAIRARSTWTCRRIVSLPSLIVLRCLQLARTVATSARHLEWSIDKDRCIRYGLRLGEHMVSRSSLAKSVVKCLPVEDIPQRLLQRCSSAAWPGLSVCEQERVECEALAWVFSEL